MIIDNLAGFGETQPSQGDLGLIFTHGLLTWEKRALQWLTRRILGSQQCSKSGIPNRTRRKWHLPWDLWRGSARGV